MNILHQDQVRSCTSCQVCGAVCPVKAIHFSLDGDGFIRPEIDNSRCVDCGACVGVCVKYDDSIKFTTKEKLEEYKLYASYSLDRDVRSSTTSGGIADILSHYLFNQGYKVIGVAYDSQLNVACHKVAKDEVDLSSFRGSKYIQPYSQDAFQTMIKECRTEKYAVFALPCQVYSISRYLSRIGKRDQCILVDLYCHGCPSFYVWEKTSRYIRRKTSQDQFDTVLWRSKMKGWGSFVLEVKKGGRRIYNSTPLRNAFFDLFFSNQLLNDSCRDCSIRGTLEYTDIRLGDFWGPSFRKDMNGISAVSVVSNKGASVFGEIKDILFTREYDYSTFLPYQSWGRQYDVDPDLRRALLDALKDNRISLQETVDLLPSHRSVRWRLKSLIKQVFFYLPTKITVFARH